MLVPAGSLVPLAAAALRRPHRCSPSQAVGQALAGPRTRQTLPVPFASLRVVGMGQKDQEKLTLRQIVSTFSGATGEDPTQRRAPWAAATAELNVAWRR